MKKYIRLRRDILPGAIVIMILVSGPAILSAKDSGLCITEKRMDGYFCLSESGKSAPLCLSSEDFAGVIRVSGHFQSDVACVTGTKPPLVLDTLPNANEMVLIGTIGKNPDIDRLIRNKKLDVSDIQGKWETFLIQIVENPAKNIDRALVIAGSDKRGTIFGMFELSQKIGVSPWYWWADVPVKKKPAVFISPGRFTAGEPKVRYRGIFINDEAPALAGWAHEKFGGFNSRFYRNVFELILRLKGNFLWPAMWGRAFYDDDPENPKLADEYGVVIGTSHHEPMMRAHVEWERYGSGPWNYEKNGSTLREFWREGIQRMDSYESVVTLAMRGDGDMAMSPTANISLLQKIVEDQRKILTEVTGRDVTTIPQVWALYKEVQEYYDKGMRVPEDVTLLLCDDNWGNLRKLPDLSGEPRKGGYGIYYHFDYVGGPRNYKWLNTNQIERVWEQMHLAYEYGAREIWIVNVGDIKPMEFPIDFFLDYAWNPETIHAEDLPQYYIRWAEEQFGAARAAAIADILAKYSKYNSRRKPELLSPDTYSLVHYREAERVLENYQSLYDQAKAISDSMPGAYRDAFYQLVLHPVEACSNLNDLYITTARNRLYAGQKRNLTNALADQVEKLFERDAEITRYYNEVMAEGKWNHMMDQTHIGYTYWQQPEKNAMPEVIKIDVPEIAEMGVCVEGSEESWPGGSGMAVLPEFDSFNRQKYDIEVFNRGETPFAYAVRPGESWLRVTPSSGEVETEMRLCVAVDWDKVPDGTHHVPVIITGPDDKKVVVHTVIHRYDALQNPDPCFLENNGIVSMEADHYTKAVASPPFTWLKIPNLGRTGSSMTVMPVTAKGGKPGDSGARLEYNVYLMSGGTAEILFYLSPTLNFCYSDGLRFAFSLDNEDPRIINMHEGDTPDWKYPDYWNESVSNNIRMAVSKQIISNPGKHVLKFWAVDPGVVLQKIVINTGGMQPSYLGPPESAVCNKSH